MLKVNEGSVHIRGSLGTVLADMTVAIHGFYKTLNEHMDDETAKKCLATCGRIALLPDDELMEIISQGKDHLE